MTPGPKKLSVCTFVNVVAKFLLNKTFERFEDTVRAGVYRTESDLPSRLVSLDVALKFADKAIVTSTKASRELFERDVMLLCCRLTYGRVDRSNDLSEPMVW